MTEKRPRTERSESEMDIEGGGEVSPTTEFQSKCKKGHMTNIYLTVSDEAFVDLVKDHEELNNETKKAL